MPTGIRELIIETGDISRFTGRFFRELFKPRLEYHELPSSVLLCGLYVCRTGVRNRIHHGLGYNDTVSTYPS